MAYTSSRNLLKVRDIVFVCTNAMEKTGEATKDMKGFGIKELRIALERAIRSGGDGLDAKTLSTAQEYLRALRLLLGEIGHDILGDSRDKLQECMQNLREAIDSRDDDGLSTHSKAFFDACKKVNGFNQSLQDVQTSERDKISAALRLSQKALDARDAPQGATRTK